MPFAVIDFETTGLLPERSDRVVEVGVVLADDEGRIEEEWTTLINPRRDIGATHIHGIRAIDVLDAPEFADISSHLLSMLAGRTVVAHNASFDMRFLHRELQLAFYELLDRPPALCSMKWAGRMIGPAKLAHCCQALDIDLTDAHSALADARATAQLVEHLLRLCGIDEEWAADVRASARFGWPATGSAIGAARSAPRGSSKPDVYGWLKSVLKAAWIPGSPEDEASYLLVLDRALLGRSISHTEGRQLLGTAEAAGISRDTVGRLHHDYLRSVAQEALADGVVTQEERADLESVAATLGLGAPYVDEALSWAADHTPDRSTTSGFALAPGDRIVFTGEMNRDRDDWVRAIVTAGLASGGVTKSTKLLVAADPDSVSGKAAKARRFGIPVVNESTFARYFDVYLAS